jgi:branched-chain amino acid transport system substrate-binding protein
MRRMSRAGSGVGSSLRWRLRRTGAAVLLLALVFAGVVTQTSSSGAASGLTASAPGITPTTITVGLITSYTGSDSSNSVPGIPESFKARIDVQNAEGGVDGRQIKFITEDDSSSPSVAATAAAAELTKGVFAIDYNSPFAYGAATYLHTQGVPVVGGGYDGPEWSTESNMFSTDGYSGTLSTTQPRYYANPTLLKKAGAKNFAVLGYSISPSSENAAKNAAISLKQAGFQVPYLDTTLPFGTVNVTATALQMKADNVDSMEAEIDGNTELALVTAGQQTGIKWRYVVLATGYGSEWLASPSAVASGQKLYFGVLQTPVELHTAATIAEQAAFKKYAGFTGVPDFGWTEGWETADLLIKGLQVAGKNPTRQSFINNLRKVTNYTAGGLLSQPTNFEKASQPAPIQCEWITQLIGHNFKPTSTKPGCSKLVPGT